MSMDPGSKSTQTTPEEVLTFPDVNSIPRTETLTNPQFSEVNATDASGVDPMVENSAFCILSLASCFN